MSRHSPEAADHTFALPSQDAVSNRKMGPKTTVSTLSSLTPISERFMRPFSSVSPKKILLEHSMSSTSFGSNASNSTNVTVASVSKRATSTPVSVEMETLHGRVVEEEVRCAKGLGQQQGLEPTWPWRCRFQPNTRTSQFWTLPDRWRGVSQTTDVSQDCICCICCRSEEDNKLASTLT